jgi:hypothetical protein
LWYNGTVNKLKNAIRHLVHGLVAWYLKRNGTFHVYPYGPDGRYVVLMSESEYHQWCEINPSCIWITVSNTVWARPLEPPFEILLCGELAIVHDVDFDGNRLCIRCEYDSHRQ